MGIQLILFTFSLKKAGQTTRFVSNASVRTSAPVKRGSVSDMTALSHNPVYGTLSLVWHVAVSVMQH